MIRNFKKLSDTNLKNTLELTIAAKKIFALCLQKNKFDFSDTTKSGKKIEMLLNSKEYSNLREFLFPAVSIVQYRNLVSFVGVGSIKFFSSHNKKSKMYDFYEQDKDGLSDPAKFDEFLAYGKKR